MSSGAPSASGWQSKKVSIALSAKRRALLREFAESIGPGMGKAEALYELIDTALPMGEAALTPHGLWDADPKAAATRAEAITPPSRALLPDDGLTTPGAGTSVPGPASLNGLVLTPKQWLAGALGKLGLPPPRSLALTLAWRLMRVSGHQGVFAEFAVSRLSANGRAISARADLPRLILAVPPGSALADISLMELSRGALLTCVADGGGWACELGAPNREAQPWLSLRC